MPRARQRETFEGRQLLLPEVRLLGFDGHRSAADLPLHAHEHEDAYEFCLTLRGSVEWWVGDEIHESGPGDVYVTRPGERHGGVDSVIHPCDLYWLLIAPPDRWGTPHLPRRDAAELKRAFAAMRLRVFRASAPVVRAFERLVHEHRVREPLSPLAARAAFYELLAGVVRDHAAAVDGGRREVSPAIRRAMAWALARLDETGGVSEWADAADLSPTQFHHRFRAEVGFTPGDWRTRQRIRLAKRLLLQTGHSVTGIAMRCGFSTSQYFATVFKRLVGVTPRDYRHAHGTSLKIGPISEQA